MTAQLFADAVARSKREILADIESGRVPANVPDFSSLHDYVDANEYGGLCDDALFDDLLPIGNDVQIAVDEWLKAGRPSAETFPPSADPAEVLQPDRQGFASTAVERGE
jgi:hypothetical protein